MAQQDEHRVPLVEEQASIRKRTVETGTVTIHTSIQERMDCLSEALARHEVTIERVPIAADVESMPDVRYEDDVVIIPIVEERLVVRKQLVLTEELRVRRQRVTEVATIPVSLRSTGVSVQREARDGREDSADDNSPTR